MPRARLLCRNNAMVASQRQLKNNVLLLLRTKSTTAVLAELGQYPAAGLLNALFSGICHADETIKWSAIAAMGAAVARLADLDMEAARVVMRRFMWNLNDESGGIGWGTPEAMAECLANHQTLAAEYTHILVSFMREDGFFLEYPPLQQGLMWGVGRLAMVRPELLRQKNASCYLRPYLDSPDTVVRALAARASGLLRDEQALARIKSLLGNPTEIRLFLDQRLQLATADSLARQAIQDIENSIQL